MLEEILFLVYFALPGAWANMAPVFAASGNWTPALNRPMDYGKSFRGVRILGDNKTFRGLVFGFVAAIIAVYVQLWAYNTFQGVRDFSLVDYSAINLPVLAVLMTIGAIGGDAVKSFFKRQLKKKPGQSWIPFDQIDSVLGVMFVAMLYIDLDPIEWFLGLIVGSLLHPFATTVGWLLKMKDSPL